MDRELNRREWVAAGFGTMVALGSWFWLVLLHDLFAQSDRPSDMWTTLRRLDWSAGINLSTATALVIGCVSVVAVVAIATATTGPLEPGAPVRDQVGWRRWLERLGTIAVLASLLSLIIVLTQIPKGSAGTILMLGVFAALGQILALALTLRSDDVSRAQWTNALKRQSEITSRTAQHFPGRVIPTLRSLAVGVLTALLRTAALPVLFAGSFAVLTGADLLEESSRWFVIFMLAALPPFVAISAYWSAWALESQVYKGVTVILFAAFFLGAMGALIRLGMASAGWWFSPLPILWGTLLLGEWKRETDSVFAQFSLRDAYRRSRREVSRLSRRKQHDPETRRVT